MRKMIQSGLLAASVIGLSFGSIASADEEMETDTGMGNNECPVGLVKDITLNEEFGDGAQELTRCIKKRNQVKVVVQINQACRDSYVSGTAVKNDVVNCAENRAYALGNITNMIADYEITHGMEAGKDYEIVAVVHSGGWGMLVKDGYQFTNIPGEGGPQSGPKTLSNPFEGQVKSLMDQGVRFLFCQ